MDQPGPAVRQRNANAAAPADILPPAAVAPARAPPPPPHPLSSLRIFTVLGLASLITLGTIYSLFANSSQSAMVVEAMSYTTPTPNYFANKHNLFNQLFVKWAWFWTSIAFILLFATSPAGIQKPVRLARFTLATIAFVLFTTWFFGPAGMDRLHIITGGECVVAIPPPSFAADMPKDPIFVPVDPNLCYTHARISPDTHPDIFSAPQIPPTLQGWSGRPHIRAGHDVSGHIFLLTLSTLVLVDELAPSLPFLFPSVRPLATTAPPSAAHLLVARFTLGLVGLWTWMTLMTSVFFHTPQEKLSGFLLGLAGFAFSQIPLPSFSTAPPINPPQVR